MSKERYDRSKPHVNIGTIGDCASVDLEAIPPMKVDENMFTRKQLWESVLRQGKRIVELEDFVEDCLARKVVLGDKLTIRARELLE